MTKQLSVAGSVRRAGRVGDGKTVTTAEIKTAAQAWYERQIARCTDAHGDHWAEIGGWIEGYLREELRQRLVARGWRANEKHR